MLHPVISKQQEKDRKKLQTLEVMAVSEHLMICLFGFVDLPIHLFTSGSLYLRTRPCTVEPQLFKHPWADANLHFFLDDSFCFDDSHRQSNAFNAPFPHVV